MKVGFTGSQRGMTAKQRFALLKVLGENKVEAFHHGDCVGADLEAHLIVRSKPNIDVVVHPPSNPKKWAFLLGTTNLLPLPYLGRNKNIVNFTDVLLAAPAGPESALPRSGTWMTVRYARKVGKKVVIL